jgi:glucosamine--fructose-6-phosphate aminotransferase (isomerizing)
MMCGIIGFTSYFSDLPTFYPLPNDYIFSKSAQELSQFRWFTYFFKSDRASLNDYAVNINDEKQAHLEREVFERIHNVKNMIRTFDSQELFIAWAIDVILSNLERIEIRGRDSAGITLQIRTCEDVLQFTYKTASLDGKLGDNKSALLKLIKEDNELWNIESNLISISAIAHTRWASTGSVSIDNCHPLVYPGINDPNEEITVVLNGDIDNFHEVIDHINHIGRSIPEEITTDTVVIPAAFHLLTNSKDEVGKRFIDTVRKLEGSFTIGALHHSLPDSIILSQRGSGQQLLLGKIDNGWIASSEVYGLVNLCDECFSIEKRELFLSPNYQINSVVPKYIGVSISDIDIKGHETFFEKEISEASDIMLKTLVYNRDINFKNLNEFFNEQRERITSIYVIGQGSAYVAGEFIASRVKERLPHLCVKPVISTEFVDMLPNIESKSTLLIPVSQSGTTTDTNHAVHLAREKEIKVCSVVNRRNSDLVKLSDVVVYTGNGTDVEISVASTKAFYAQMFAGEIISLILGRGDIGDLNQIVENVKKFMKYTKGNVSLDEHAKLLLSKPSWSVVGNGNDKIMADELRIKLSELCYKSVSCDYTSNKKHIDLSSESCVIVCAADTKDNTLNDVLKDCESFKSHNNDPIIIITEKFKNQFTNAGFLNLIIIPDYGNGFSNMNGEIIIAHKLALRVAKGINSVSLKLEKLYETLTDTKCYNVNNKLNEFNDIIKNMSSMIHANDVVLVFNDIFRNDDHTELKRLAIELRRPIDTIRHQAKTITVGASKQL